MKTQALVLADDPVYKKNLQRLIERNREFEEAKE